MADVEGAAISVKTLSVIIGIMYAIMMALIGIIWSNLTTTIHELRDNQRTIYEMAIKQGERQSAIQTMFATLDARTDKLERVIFTYPLEGHR